MGMKRTSIVWFVAIFILAVVLLQSSILIYKDASGPDLTAKATQAPFSMCINHEPFLDDINVSCNTTLPQNKYYACQLNVSDVDSDNLTFSTQNYSGNLYFNITDEGVIYAQPDDSAVGDTLVIFSVEDNTDCLNNVISKQTWFTVFDSNDPPVFVPPMGPFDWTLGEDYRGVFLDVYFYDPDNDPLTYSYSAVPSGFLVSLTESNELILSATKCGEGTMIFTAKDPGNLTGSSTPIRLNVPCPAPAGDSGGGGGFGACTSDWYCGDWQDCLENGTQRKRCEDHAGCDDEVLYVWKNCTYIPECENGVLDSGEQGIDCGGSCPPCETCTDGIQNHGELGVDCGGPCKICMNCLDGIRNFGETDVDCGGPCPACPTCFDGVQNQGELGVDCGGPCQVCKSLEVPGPVDAKNNDLLFYIIGIVAVLAALAVAYRLFHKQLQTILAKLLLMFIRSHNKEILLTDDQRDMLLDDLAHLEKRKLFSHPVKKHLSIFQDELSVILRKLYIFLIGNSVDINDVDVLIDKLQTTHLVRHILKKHYTHLLVLEQNPNLQVSDLKLHLEILRERIFSISHVSRKHIAREVSEMPEGEHGVDAMNGVLHNLFLSLQYGNSFVAKKKYMKALNVYESLTLHEQTAVFSPLHLAFDEIRYVSTYSRK